VTAKTPPSALVALGDGAAVSLGAALIYWPSEGGAPLCLPRAGVMRVDLFGPSCLLSTTGRLECWGKISGWHGSASKCTQPALSIHERVLVTPNAEDFSVGGAHLCWLEQQRPRCIGDVPDSDGTDACVPFDAAPSEVTVADGHVPSLLSFAAGPAPCALADDRSAWCWPTHLQGHGPFPRSGPLGQARRLDGWTDVRQLANGWTSACALDGAGRVTCRGCNSHGQLGIAPAWRSGSSQPPPADAMSRHDLPEWCAQIEESSNVLGSEVATSLRCSDAHCCALSAQGVVSCWGANELGQLGRNTRTLYELPGPVPLAEPVIAFDVDRSTGCALTRSRRLWCWGTTSGHGLEPEQQATRIELRQVAGVPDCSAP
jgi:hypothetical protein